MKNIFTIILIAFFSSSIFCQTQTCLQNLNHPGYKSISQVTSSETIVREYILHIPTNYNVENSTPLVINLHGFGDCAAEFSETVGDFYNFNELADQENFLVAYPQGAYRPEKEDTYWEPGDNGSMNIFENDNYFFEQLIAEINTEFNLDLNKIYAIGYSNGGMMAYSLACNKNDLFSAVGIMSGVMLEEDCMLDNSIPIIKFHGIADEVLPYAGNLWYQSVSDVVNFWLDKNNIPSNSLITTELSDGKVVRDEYFGGNENSCFQLYTINEEWDKPGDHVWFSEPIEGSSPNKIMWDFFVDNCSSISSTKQDFESNLNLKISPNPFLDQITIDSKFPIGEPFTIYNIQGNYEATGIINSNPFTIDLSLLPPNIYILNVGGNIRKIIKIK